MKNKVSVKGKNFSIEDVDLETKQLVIEPSGGPEYILREGNIDDYSFVKGLSGNKLPENIVIFIDKEAIRNDLNDAEFLETYNEMLERQQGYTFIKFSNLISICYARDGLLINAIDEYGHFQTFLFSTVHYIRFFVGEPSEDAAIRADLIKRNFSLCLNEDALQCFINFIKSGLITIDDVPRKADHVYSD